MLRRPATEMLLVSRKCYAVALQTKGRCATATLVETFETRRGVLSRSRLPNSQKRACAAIGCTASEALRPVRGSPPLFRAVAGLRIAVEPWRPPKSAAVVGTESEAVLQTTGALLRPVGMRGSISEQIPPSSQ